MRALALRSILLSLCLAVAPAAQSSDDAGRKPIEPGEADAYLAKTPGVGVSPDGQWLAYSVNKGKMGLGAGVLNLRTGKLYDAGRPDIFEYWSVFYCYPEAVWSPSGRDAIFLTLLAGRKHLVLWSPKPEDTVLSTKRLLSLPRNLESANKGVWSLDGKTYYFTITHNLAKRKSNADRDEPPTDSVNVSLKMTAPYEVEDPDLRVPKEYPEAYGEGTRALIVAIDVESGRLGLLARGNDVDSLYLSPDGKQLLVMQTKQVQPDKDASWTHQAYNDVYRLDLPSPAQLPAIDLKTFNQRTAGWSDHRGARLTPILKDLLLNDTSAYLPGAATGTNGNPAFTWSPDGKYVAYATVGREATGDVFTYELATRSLRNLTEGLQLKPLPKTKTYQPSLYKYSSRKFGGFFPPLWTQDSKALVITGGGDAWKIPLGTGENPVNLTAEVPQAAWQIVRKTQAGTPQLDRNGRIVVIARDRLSRRDSVWAVDVSQAAATKVADTDMSLDLSLGADQHGEYVVYSGINETHGRNIYRLDLAADSAPRRVTDLQLEVSERRFPDTRLLEYTVPGIGTGFALLYVPEGASTGKPVPMVLNGYPSNELGVLESRTWVGPGSYSENIHSLLARGMAALEMPDLPLSPEGVYAKPARQIFDGVMAATAAALETGLIDKNRLGIRGGSYGGYMVQAVITQTDMFKAAVSMAGTASMMSQYLSDSRHGPKWAEIGQGRMQVPLWEAPMNYVESSPLIHFDKVRTPLLLIHGEEDLVVPIQASAESFRALQRLNRPVIFARSRRAEHQMNQELVQREALWFAEHLLGAKRVSHLADQGSFFMGGVRKGDKLADPQ